MMFHACFWSRRPTLAPLLKWLAVMVVLLAMAPWAPAGGGPSAVSLSWGFGF